MRALVIGSFVSLAALVTGCSDGSSAPVVAKQAGIAVVRGTVKGYTTTDGSAAAQAAHDGVVAQIKPSIMNAGDHAHTVFLGVADPSAFLAVDRWDDLAAARATYGSASFQMGFAAVLEGAPSIDYYVVAPGFTTYGTLDAAVNGLPSFGLVVEGTLKDADMAKSAAAQNMIVDGGKAAAMALSDVAHVPFIAEETTQGYFNIDIWMNPANAQTFFSDPQVATAFAGLFASPPTVTPYAATSWAQW